MPKPPMLDLNGQLPRHAGNQQKWLRLRALSQITDIAVHWNGPKVREPDDMRQLRADAIYHITKNWAAPGDPPAYGWTIMYHYAIGLGGQIYILNPENWVLWHDTDGNYHGLAIHLLIGEGQEMSEAMKNSLLSLVHWLTEERPEIPAGNKDVWGHGELTRYRNNTSCPGPEARKWCQDYRAGLLQPGDRQYFAETDQWVNHDFFRFWSENGGLSIFGYPIEAEKERVYPDGSKRMVQYFERARFERAEAGTQLGLVGREALDAEHK